MYYIQKDGAADCAQEKCKQVEAAAEANAAKAAAHDAAQDKCFKMEVEFAGTIRLGTRRVKEEGIRALGTQAKPGQAVTFYICGYSLGFLHSVTSLSQTLRNLGTCRTQAFLG